MTILRLKFDSEDMLMEPLGVVGRVVVMPETVEPAVWH